MHKAPIYRVFDANGDCHGGSDIKSEAQKIANRAILTNRPGIHIWDRVEGRQVALRPFRKLGGK